MADVSSVIASYVNLLIIQYHNKPKAQAMIELFIREIVANGILLDIQDAYNIDTAVGAQLDVLGQYIGVDRFYKAQDLHDYFSLTEYAEISIDPLKYGFTNYTDYGTQPATGTLTYDDIVQTNFRLDDDNYRILLKLKIIQNSSDHSHKSIDNSVFEFFGNDVVPSSSGNMRMYYFIPHSSAEVVKAAISKEVMPRPMGVGLDYIQQADPFFSFCSYQYDQTTDSEITGFTNYSLYSSKTGETLNYEKINRGF